MGVVKTSAPHLDTPPPAVLETSDHDGIRRLVLNNPTARNCLSMELMLRLKDEIEKLGTDPSIRTAVIAARGTAFCAGHDLKELKSHQRETDGGASFFQRLFRICGDMMVSIVECPKPIIAEVQGMATAAGCQLVATCDLAVASSAARFATPGVNIGLFCSTPMVALSRNVGRKKAMEMLITGDPISAQEAERIGLINRVVEERRLQSTVIQLAKKIVAKSSPVIALGKRAFYDQAEMNLRDAYAYTGEVMTRNMLTDDAAEGISAFLEKRAPTWRGQ